MKKLLFYILALSSLASADIWTRYAATPTNLSYIKTTYNVNDVIKSEDANKIGSEVNALNRFMRTGAGSPTAISNLIVAVGVSNFLSLTGLNVMQTNLNMGGFSITNVQDLYVSSNTIYYGGTPIEEIWIGYTDNATSVVTSTVLAYIDNATNMALSVAYTSSTNYTDIAVAGATNAAVMKAGDRMSGQLWLTNADGRFTYLCDQSIDFCGTHISSYSRIGLTGTARRITFYNNSFPLSLIPIEFGDPSSPNDGVTLSFLSSVTNELTLFSLSNTASVILGATNNLYTASTNYTGLAVAGATNAALIKSGGTMTGTIKGPSVETLTGNFANSWIGRLTVTNLDVLNMTATNLALFTTNVTVQGVLNMSGFAITNMADPTLPKSAVTMQYAQSISNVIWTNTLNLAANATNVVFTNTLNRIANSTNSLWTNTLNLVGGATNAVMTSLNSATNQLVATNSLVTMSGNIGYLFSADSTGTNLYFTSASIDAGTNSLRTVEIAALYVSNQTETLRVDGLFVSNNALATANATSIVTFAQASNIVNGAITANTNCSFLIDRKGITYGKTSLFEALSMVISGDRLRIMPGIYDIDNCAGLSKWWSTNGLVDFTMEGVGKVTLRSYVYTATSYPLYFALCTNFVMRNITFDVHRNSLGYSFGIQHSINVLIDNCKFFLRVDGTATVCKSLVVLSDSNGVVRSCVVGVFDSGLNNTNYFLATHGLETVLVEDSIFIDDGKSVALTVGDTMLRGCRGTRILADNMLPISQREAQVFTDHLYDSFVAGFTIDKTACQGYFSVSPLTNRYIVVAPNLPNIMGYCGTYLNSALPNNYTGTVRMYGHIDYVGATILSTRSNLDVVIDFEGCTFKMGSSGVGLILQGINNSRVEMKNLRISDAGTAYVASWGVRAQSCTGSIFILRDSILEKTLQSDRMHLLTGAAAVGNGNVNNSCSTMNCIRLSYTNEVFGLDAYDSINSATYDWTNGWVDKPVFTQ